MLRRRSEAREHSRSRARIQIPIESIEEEEWFDGDEVSPTLCETISHLFHQMVKLVYFHNWLQFLF